MPGTPTRYKRSPKPQTYKEALQKFVTLSTIRGMKRVAMSPNWSWSLLWLAAIFVSLGAIIFQLIQNIQIYSQHQVIQTHFELIDKYINYPSFTICPLQPFNSRFAQPNVSKEYLNGDMHVLTYLKLLEEKKKAGIFTEAMLTLDAEGLATIGGYFQNIKPENAIKFGHAEDNLIVDCTIEKTNADTGMKHYDPCVNISQIYSAQYFNCYTVTTPGSNDTSVSKLSLILYLDDFGTIHYPTTLSRDSRSQMHGVKVVIHEDDTWPDVLEMGDEIAPGIAATFFLNELETTLEVQPWGNCSDVPEDRQTFVDYIGQEYKYTQDLCKKYESQRKIIEQCGCKMALLPLPKMDVNISDIYFCDDISLPLEELERKMNCTHDQMKSLRDYDFDDELDQLCPLPCTVISYKYIKALSQWPHDAYHLSFYERFIRHKKFADKFQLYENISALEATDHFGAYKMLLDSDLIERNFIKLEFKMNPVVKMIKEEPKMTDTQLLSNVGGTLSLWLGISTIALLEFIEFIVDVFRVFRSRQGCNTTLSVSADDTVNSAAAKSTGARENHIQISSLDGSAVANGHAPHDTIERYSKFSEDFWF